MNNALFLFLILLLGLVLCSFLGSNCRREGLTNEDNSQPQTGVSGDTSIQTKLKNYYDNYNHFNGTSSISTNASTYYGPNGGVAKIITNADGTQSLQVTVNTNSSPVIFVADPSMSTNTSPTSMTSMTSTTSPDTSSTVFYGPNGNTATIVNTQQGTAIQVNTGNGTMTFTSMMPASTTPSSTETSGMSSTQYYGSTGTPVPSGNYTLGYNPSVNTFTGPNGNTAYYAQGPMGNTVMGVTDYSSSLPAGIPKSRIPPGEEDLYILKSQVVPPVCPACPTSSACPREKPCPACPPCARCPEPSITCKAVPNYSAANYDNGMSNDGPFGGMINNQYIPVPVLNDFSTFGS
jgi:hypothetical protein